MLQNIGTTSVHTHNPSLTPSLLTEFAVAETFLLHLAPKRPDTTQFCLLVVGVLSELSQSFLFRHLLMLLLILLL